MLVDGLAVAAGFVVPVGHRAFIEAVGGDDGLGRAAVAQQGGDGDEQGAVLVEAIEGGALGGSEGHAAGGAAEALAVAAVDLDVATAEQSPGRAVGVVTECLGGVHGVPPFRLRLASLPVRMFPGPPFDYLLSPFHGSLGCYPPWDSNQKLRTRHSSSAGTASH